MTDVLAGQSFDEREKGCPTTGDVTAEVLDLIDATAFVKCEDEQTNRLELSVFGAHCAGCLKKIENGLSSLPGVKLARLNLSTGKLVVKWQKEFPHTPNKVMETLSNLGYRAAPYDPSVAAQQTDDYGRRLIKSLAVAGFAMGNIMLLSVSVWSGQLDMGPGTRTMLHWISALIAIPAIAYAGRPFFESALSVLKKGQTNMDVPISLAVLLAVGISLYETSRQGEIAYFDAAVMLLFFLLIGRWLDHSLRSKAREAARDLLALQAVTANKLDAHEHITPVAAREIEPGDQLVLFPGDRLPVNGRIIQGQSEVDMSLVTGESMPVAVAPGTMLYAGINNISQRLTVESTARVEDSLIADLARLIEAGEQSRNKYVRLSDRAAALYVPVIHGLALATFLGWLLWMGEPLRIAGMHAVAVLIIACPCALGLAVPAVQVVATGRLFHMGILVKSGDALERLAQTDHIVFDKTGTLTKGQFELINRTDITPGTLEKAACVARASRHPLARAIVKIMGKGVIAEDVEEVAGQGVCGRVDGETVRIGNSDWVGVAEQKSDQGTEMWVKVGNQSPIRLLFQDQLRIDTAEALKALSHQGMNVELLSGDTRAAVEAVVNEIDLTNWKARQSPSDKLDRLNDLKQTGKHVLMVGDGLNDAPALAGAHVSMSPGTAVDVSQSAADLVFQNNSLKAVPTAIDVARQARRRVFENFAFAALYNVVAIPFAMSGGVTPLIAALAMSSSSIIVTLNALRLTTRNVTKTEMVS